MDFKKTGALWELQITLIGLPVCFKMADVYDVCVIGAGIEGSSTARYSASRGKKTLLLEQVMLTSWYMIFYKRSSLCRRSWHKSP